jgi:serine/threonine protein kinase
MDREKAANLFEKLRPRGVAGWELHELKDNGKSAAVFKASKDGVLAALKVYDNELITRYGDEALLTRMERESALIGATHPNLVDIFELGFDEAIGQHYLAMEFIEGNALSDALATLPTDRLPAVIERLASAAEYLESLGLAHRDIKPANIVMRADDQPVLLDYGVLRPIGESGITDGSGELFVGTNQYASPEFALREEEDTPEGWRAVTFYQLGAVLHDLIMRKPLFGEHLKVPARLAQAVQREIPDIRSADVDPYLVTLAQNCLVKSPSMRLRLVSWNTFKARPAPTDKAAALRARIRERAAASKTRAQQHSLYSGADADTQSAVLHTASEIVLDTIRNLGQQDPPLPRRISYPVGTDRSQLRFEFEPAADLGLPTGLNLGVRISVLDFGGRIVELRGGALQSGEDGIGPCETVIYEGPLDQEQMATSLTIFVWEAVDTAQEVAAAPEA